MHAKREIRAKARELRMNGVSVRDIAQMLDVSRSSVSTWVRDITLTVEQVAALKDHQRRYAGQNAGGQSNRNLHRNQRMLYQAEGRQRAKEHRELHLIGCMLYWAEGAKAKNGVYFANSDANMLLLFLRFLREEMRIDDQAVKLLIHCHSSDPIEMQRIEQYWLDLLCLPSSALSKTQIKKGSNTRKNVLENGVCSIRVYRTQLAQHIFGAIQEYAGFDNPDWLF